ncbi:MAG: V-type ATP synthase subunit B, partial [Candidatus Hydrogenedentes bacterium]|nr:V-type ATP synthase subunit B [Candidatus Hydrogenedentota bacterium]
MSSGDFIRKEYWDINYVSGPLVFLRTGNRFATGSMLNLVLESGDVRQGQVLETSETHAVVQVLQGTHGISVETTSVSLRADAARVGVSPDMLGQRLNGAGVPLTGEQTYAVEKEIDINGAAINPVARDKPNDFIETGISAIDGFNTLVRGQKLPIFSGAGLPANEVADLIVRQSATRNDDEDFVVVFAAMGITERESAFFLNSFAQGAQSTQVVAVINKANDPAIERLFTPRCALTIAEYL